MWISKERFNEMQEKLDQIDKRLDIVISKTIEEPDYNKSECSSNVRNGFLKAYPAKRETASTPWMKDITLEDLVGFCISGKPITKPVNPEINVKAVNKYGDCPKYGYYNRGGSI